MGSYDVQQIWNILGGDAPIEPLTWPQLAARGSVVYLTGLLLVRLGKSRLLSGSTPLDVVLAFILGSVLSRAVNGTVSLSGTIVAAATLVVMHWIFTALAFHSHWWGGLIKGNPYVLVRNGRINRTNLRRAHLSVNDLKQQLRQQANTDNVRDIKLAMKERSGEISFIKNDTSPRVLNIQVAEGVQTVRIVFDPGHHQAEENNSPTAPRKKLTTTS